MRILRQEEINDDYKGNRAGKRGAEEIIHHTRICTNNLGVQNDIKTRNETRLGRRHVARIASISVFSWKYCADAVEQMYR